MDAVSRPGERPPVPPGGAPDGKDGHRNGRAEGRMPATGARLARFTAWLDLTRPDDSPELSRRDRVLLRWEIFAVFAVSLGASGVSAFVSLIGSLTAHHSLASQSVTLNGSQAPGRPLLDLFLQLVSHRLRRGPRGAGVLPAGPRATTLPSIGVDRTQPRRDLLRGAGLAALIGGSGLGLYFIAYKSGSR